MAKKKVTLPKGFEEVDGKIINSDSKEEYKMDGSDLVCISTGEVFEEAPVLKKKFTKLSDYKAKINFKDVKYKPQEWINMSHAFKEVTRLPGLPVCGVIQAIGKSNSGKTTLALEAAANAQKQGILPVFIITENKFSFERASEMGIDFDESIVHSGVQTIEEGCNYIRETLDAQEKGDLPYDLLFIWDSIGATPSKAELAKKEDGGSGGGMMVTARVLREEITRYIGPRINSTRLENFPYNSTLLVVNHAYVSPPAHPMGQPTLEPYGGDAVYLASSLVFRMGGIKTRPSMVTAVKDKVEIAFASKTSIVVEKNHVTNISSKGKILCTDYGFISDDKKSIDAYKDEYKSGWDLKFDKYWDSVSDD
jgi:hypothetical protein